MRFAGINGMMHERGEVQSMEITFEVLKAILDAYPYEVVFVDRTHTVRWMNRTALTRYGQRVIIGNSLFNCHNESTKPKIENFLRRADEGEDEMFETYNRKTGEREFFVPVRDQDGKVVGYFERHEVPWTPENASEPVGEYWLRRLAKPE
jgi:DUF438 domain-containing protein